MCLVDFCFLNPNVRTGHRETLVMLSVEELDSIIINSDPEKESLKDIVSGLEPFDAKNLIA